MNIYETVKAAISMRDAAEHYGLKVNRNGMDYCPFYRVVASSISLAPPQAAGLVHSAFCHFLEKQLINLFPGTGRGIEVSRIFLCPFPLNSPPMRYIFLDSFH